jgi:superfamily II DNA or RNA helicase
MSDIQLRPYQSELFAAIHGAVKRGVKRPLVVAPTGSGKTVMFCYTVGRSAKAGKRSVILVHRQELLEQTSKTLTTFGISHGLIAAGCRPDPFQCVQVAMVATLKNRMATIQKPDLIVVDEAHHGMAGSYKAIFDHFLDAHIIGFTATPERLDGKGLGDVFDEIIYGPSVQWLMDNGHLAPAKYYAPPSDLDVSGVSKSRGDFVKSELVDAMGKSSIMGDCVRHYKRLSFGKPAVAFCVNIQHAHDTAAAFNQAGIPAGVIDGKMTKEERRSIVKSLADGSILVLTSCEIINEGFDLPVVTTAILLRKTQSLGLHLQQIGRVLRTHPGKTHSIVIDHVTNLSNHGVAEQEREWSLEGRTKAARNAPAADGFTQCEECYCMFDSKENDECPECGWTKPKPVARREVVDVDLVEFNQQSPQEKRDEDRAAKSYKDLVAIGKRRGYKRGWAYHQAKERGFTIPFNPYRKARA